MKINHISITSATALNLDFTVTAPICVLHGRYSDLALDLIREVIGDSAKNDPDRVDDGRFVIHADVETDNKNYNVCYIRNADFMGDNRIAVNFEPNSIRFSEDDTHEFVAKRNEENDSPLFIYDAFDRLDEAVDVTPKINQLSALEKQVFVAVCANYPVEKMKHDHLQIINTEENHGEN